MKRPVLALGGIVLIGIGVVMALGWWSESTANAQGQVTVPVRSVRIDSDSGSVKIRAGDVRATTVLQHFSYHWAKPGDGYRINGDQLVLSTCGWNCTVDYDVVVPRGATVTGRADSGSIELNGVASADVRADSGSLTIRDVAGPVKAQADSGGIHLVGIGENVTAKAGSGPITGEGLRGEVDAQANSGSVKLRLDVARNVRASADSGDVDVTVPNDRYRIEGTTGSGNRTIKVPTDASASWTLRFDTDSGDVSVNVA
jgi:DUF4097 and DUF4098 domain-containing protein YvlB